MPVRDRILFVAIAGLLVSGLAYCSLVHLGRGASVQADAPVPAPGKSNASVVIGPSPGVAADPVLRVRLDQVLATVNGHRITVRDAVPASGTNEELELSPGDLKFFLNRAVDRELIFEAAQKQGISLDESQREQLAASQAMRNQREPGGLAQFNADPASRELEALDAQAFMLQTSLMEARGASPNVSESQVQDYFQQHQSDFGNLPADPNARNQAWQQVDFQIRTLLAASTRSNYNQQLADYMQQIQSQANVVLNSLIQ